MRKLTHFQPDLITSSFFPKDLSAPDKINCGRCFLWAYLTFKVFKGVQLYRTSIHAFVKHGSRFYDSEAIQGVKSPALLPIHKRYSQKYPTIILPHYKLPEAEFKFQWGQDLCRFNLSWFDLSDRARELLGKYQ